MRRARIVGTGFYVPPYLETNAELEAKLGTPLPESIEKRVGIRQRYLTGPDLSSADLGCEACWAAIGDAGLKPADIDLLIVATDTPEYISPPTSAVIQGRLGAVNAGIYDLNASCAGFVAALDTAARMIGYDGQYNNVLVCGVYNMSKYADLTDSRVAAIFADGGGAVILQAAEGESGYLAARLYADGTQYDFLGIYGGGTKHPLTEEMIREKKHLLTFLKPLPPDRNIQMWPGLVTEAVARAGITVAEIDHILFTQINRWVIEEVMAILKLPMDRTTCIMDRFGYTGSACIPMALHDALKAGRIQSGDRVVMVGSGVGLSVAVAVFRW